MKLQRCAFLLELDVTRSNHCATFTTLKVSFSLKGQTNQIQASVNYTVPGLSGRSLNNGVTAENFVDLAVSLTALSVLVWNILASLESYAKTFSV
jgi:hypothetical protein